MFKALITMLVALPVAAMAAGTGGSEFFYQAEEGKHDVTPSFSYRTGNIKTTGSEVDVTNTNYGVSYEYGLMPELSLGAELSFGSNEEDDGTTATTESGLQNIELTAKATMPMGSGAFKYGATLSLSPGDKVTDTSGDSNGYTGGHTLTPYVGYELNADPCAYGVKLAVDVGLSDRAVEDESTNTTTDYSGEEDTTISLFYEHKFSEDMKLGASLDWTTTSDEKNETNSTTDEKLTPTQTLNVYLPTKLGDGTLLPQLSYVMTTDDKVGTADVDSFSFTALSVGYRMVF